MKIARPIAALIESFQKLPGIGPRSAQRLTYYLLHVPQVQLDDFAESVSRLKKDTVLCSVCKNVSETNPCPICSDPSRDQSVVLVVEQPLDILAFEKTGRYKGSYHVLHGAINPLDNIGPDEIYIDDLIKRAPEMSELIVATNPTMEGEATAMFINKQLKNKSLKLKITRLGMGIPTGADLEYADEVTLTQALEGRRELT
ncbi:MAG: Recombination protein RecR [Microgenomates group bacterium GW2011_GWC1_43_13]|uniref:Recombination protein RecR n=3 Tax=Candidatus Woeseibacteriota TaxID=1752722 RepID=A0A837I987_9BACT|nr:MAG: Recombination protein RecR [Microgenomates group bacterium GW2011_GWC1_43_13]KKT33241.1 MAG: Recombination protein RecR [Candidatus Woesebacteria bacterium GW2011_GWB1_44_11]KKT54357.1 MAG: Recombination protein RecR [Candidatus Woesebacteria bacterium GW2011_GWA1_44_23]OGM76614.1 MAG: recombination protein RecR [Candidatus Woesebacteria bacterium RIFOXYA1_FULL_43_16]OGM82614.1 MAG: recombination protein RecR [Candidatus Woesebacteria bacterium RIFOXYB1_FULL_42_36]OGM84764.1 MAG: recom